MPLAYVANYMSKKDKIVGVSANNKEHETDESLTTLIEEHYQVSTFVKEIAHFTMFSPRFAKPKTHH